MKIVFVFLSIVGVFIIGSSEYYQSKARASEAAQLKTQLIQINQSLIEINQTNAKILLALQGRR